MHSLLDRLRERFGGVRIFASSRSRTRFVVHALVVAAGLAVAGVLLGPHLAFLTDARAVRTFVRGYGVWAPVVLIALQAVQVVAAPVPGQVLAVVAGYLFGAWWGTLYNMIGITIGSTVAFWLSRRYGRAYVEDIVHEGALERFDAIGDDYARPALFFLFLIPGLPDDVICFAGGLTDIPLWQLVVLAVVGPAVGRSRLFVLALVVVRRLADGLLEPVVVSHGHRPRSRHIRGTQWRDRNERSVRWGGVPVPVESADLVSPRFRPGPRERVYVGARGTTGR